MLPLCEQLSKEEIHTFLVPLLDALLLELKDCVSCEAKFLVFAEKFCAKSRLQTFRYRRCYKYCYDEARPVLGKKRDYRAEVEAVIAKYSEEEQMG